jgi:ATP-dependent DNA ligase
LRPEKGGEVFDEFLKLIKTNEALFNSVAGASNSKVKVEEIVAGYREAVGLDLIKTAAANPVPIAPMKLKKVKSVDEVLENYKPEDLIVQQKFDGWKSQVIKNGGSTKIYSRRGEEFQDNVPELVAELNKKLENGDFVLGEITYEINGKQNISNLQSITGSNKEKALEFQKNNKGKIVLQAYDLLWNKGKNLTDEPYHKRYDVLKTKIGKSTDVKIPHNYSWGEKETAIKDALKVGGEGIVIKPKNSTYKYETKGNSEPVGEWIKFKPGNKAHETDVIVKNYTKGEGGKLIFPAYQHQNGKMIEVSKISGLPKEDEDYVKKQIDDGKQVVLEVGYQEIMESNKLRHPGFHRVRKDKNPKQASRFISKRAGVLDLHPDVKKIIDSYCHNTGGTKSVHSIISFLRDRFGNEIKFNDEELKKYIEDRKAHFHTHHESFNAEDVGKVGTESSNEYDDSTADYFSHGK